MNILFISHYEKLYGANRSLLLLLDGLVDNNIKPLVLVPRNGPFITELKKRGIAYHIIYFKPWMGVKSKMFFIKALLRFMINILVLPVILFFAIRFKPSVIYTNSSVTPIGFYLSMILRAPHIWHVRELGKRDYNLDYDFGKKYFYYFMRKSDSIIVISEFVKKEIFHGEWENLNVVNNSVVIKDDEGISKVDKEFSGKEYFTFLVMSLILPSKGIQDAIEAIGILKKDLINVKLVIYGGIEDKVYKNQLDNLINKLKLNDEVLFKGFTDKPFAVYKSADAVLVCSRNEAWGRVAAEAMVSEKPVIGYNCGGTKEIIIDGFNGLLYNNVEELALKMKEISFNKDLVNKLKSNAKKTAKDQFSNNRYTLSVLNIIEKISK